MTDRHNDRAAGQRSAGRRFGRGGPRRAIPHSTIVSNLITEASDNLVTEAGDLLITE